MLTLKKIEENAKALVILRKARQYVYNNSNNLKSIDYKDAWILIGIAFNNLVIELRDNSELDSVFINELIMVAEFRERYRRIQK